MSLLLYFLNNNFINFILWKLLLESNSQNVRERNKNVLSHFFFYYFTLKKCIASGYYCLCSSFIPTLIYSAYCFTLGFRSAQNYFLQTFRTLFNVIWEKIFIANLLFLMDSQFSVDTPFKSKGPYVLLNKNINFGKNKTESKSESPTQT